MTATTRSIAVAQTCPVRGDVKTNLAEHLRLARIAAAEGARIVVFPELSLTGYELDLASELAFSEDDPRLAPLVEAAASASMTLVVGAPVRIGSRLHIGAFIISPDRTTALYTKHHLGSFPAAAGRDGTVPPAESTVFEPGDRDALVRFGDSIAAVAVCADIGRPSHPRQAADRGATTYLAGMFVIPSEFDGEATKLRDHALEYSMVVAFANFGGPSGGLAAAGRSGVWSANGELLVRLDDAGAGIAVVTETEQGWETKTHMLSGNVEGTTTTGLH